MRRITLYPALLALFMLALTVGSVSADDVVFSDEIGTRPTSWSDVLQIPRFDPSLGILSAVEVELTSTIEGDAAFENLGPSSTVVTMVHGAEVNVLLPTGSNLVGVPTDIYATTLPPFDGVDDYGGDSGDRRVLMANETISLTLTTDAEKAPFVGAGLLEIPVNASGTTESDGPGNFNVLLRANASGTSLGITYVFDVPHISIETYTNGFDADDANDPDVPSIASGNVTIWTYEVRNTGDVPFALSEVVVTDSVTGVTPTFVPSSDDGDEVLSPAEVWIYEFTTVAIDLRTAPDGTPIVPGCDPGATSNVVPTYENVGSVAVDRYNLTDSDPTHHCNTPDSSITLRKLIDGIEVESNKAANVPAYAIDAPIVWTYEVKNDSEDAYKLSEISLTDSDPAVNPSRDASSDDGGDSILSIGETWIYTATGTAQNLDQPLPGTTIVSGCGPDPINANRPVYQNIASLVAGDSVVVDASFYCQDRETTLTIQKLTNGIDADGANDADVPLIAPGDPVTWTYQVQNTGDVAVAMSDIKVTDSQPGITPQPVSSSDNGADEVLSPGETWTYQAVSVAQYLDVPSPTITVVDGCNPTGADLPRAAYENVGTVALGSAITTDSSHYCNPPVPRIDVEKLTNDVDADDPNGAGVPEITVGTPVNWTYVVRNLGNVPFRQADVQLVDSDPAVTPVLDPTSDVDGDQILSPSETWRYAATGIAADLTPPVAGIATVVGCDPANLGLTLLAYMNMATVTVPGATADDPSHYCNVPDTGIKIEKRTNTQDADHPDDRFIPVLGISDSVTWTYVVENTGNVTFTLAEVSVTDSDPAVTPERVADSDDNGDGLLSPGERWNYIFFGTAQDLNAPAAGTTIVSGCDPEQTGLKIPTYQNMAVVRAGASVDADPSHYCVSTERHLQLQKFTNGVDVTNANDPATPKVLPGDQIEWLFVVTNLGTEVIPLSEVSVTDSDHSVTPIFDPSSDANGDKLLSPGEVWTYQAKGNAHDLKALEELAAIDNTVTVVDGCTENGTTPPRFTYQNVGKVQAGTAADSDISFYCNLEEGIVFQKLTNGADAKNPEGPDVPVLLPGTPVTWSYIVTNTGEVAYPQSDVTVIDSDPGIIIALDAASDAGADQTLSPGESWTYQGIGQVRVLDAADFGVAIVPGCSSLNNMSAQPTYENTGAVRIKSLTASDKSHYCNPIDPDFEIEKFTNGVDADDPNGADVPHIIPGTLAQRAGEAAIKWTYMITNTGSIDFTLDDITLVESDTTLTPVLDASTDEGGDRILSIGESWTFVAEADALDLVERTSDARVVAGCTSEEGDTSSGIGLAYRNVVTVNIGQISKSDPSHYCNPAPTSLSLTSEPSGDGLFLKIYIPIVTEAQ